MRQRRLMASIHLRNSSPSRTWTALSENFPTIEQERTDWVLRRVRERSAAPSPNGRSEWRALQWLVAQRSGAGSI